MKNRVPSLEALAAFHAGVLAIFSAWAFGGGIRWATNAISIGGSIGLLITAASVRERLASSQGSLRTLHAFWPLLVFNALALVSVAHPAFRHAEIEGAAVLAPVPHALFWPVSARPELSLVSLWLFDAIFIVCFNLAFVVRRRRTLRTLLLTIAANALVLAVFGSLQKLTRADGIYFGRFASPNKTFFASFIYHNHWGAWAVLMLGVCLALIFDRTRKPSQRNFWHSPAFSGIIAMLFLAATIPLAGSRSCTALALMLLAGALVTGVKRIARERRAQGRSAAAPVLIVVLVSLVAAGAIYDLAQTDIEARFTDTQEQLAAMRAQGGIGARAELYHDSWQMALDRPWFGWGIGSYATVFMLYNTQKPNADRLPVFYENAHSDWIQAAAETGFVGLALLLALALVPLTWLRSCLPLGAVPTCLLAACGLIAAYAWFEFPFANSAVLIAWGVCFFAAIRWAQFDHRDRESD